MTKITLCTFLIICTGFLPSAKLDDVAYCFQYTWITPSHNINPDKFNCTELKDFPCIDPPIITEESPDTDDYWKDNGSFNKSRLCILTSANACVKYTYMFNGGIVRMSSFCGRVTEDNMQPVTSGCYQQRKNSHDLEVCVCQSKKGRRPCNLSVQMRYSVTLIVTALIFTFMKTMY